MRPSERRRYGLLDLMIVIAGAALGCALTIQYRAFFADAMGRHEMGYPPDWTLLAAPDGFLQALSVSFLVVALRRPRPPLRRALRAPGTQACFVGVVVTALQVLVCASVSAYRLNGAPPWAPAAVFLIFLAVGTGPAVLLVWLVAWLTRTCRPEPTWVDRVGRLVGAGWVVAGVCVQVMIVLA